MVCPRQTYSGLCELISISATKELSRLRKNLADVHKKHIPYAAKVALNETGMKVKGGQKEEMKRVFKSPTKFTLNSSYLKSATKQDLRAAVGLKDWALKGTPASKYLSPQIEGGKRRLKGFEVLLNRRGVLPDGYYAVPSRKAKKDAYGNLNKGLLNQIISYSGAQRDRAQNTKQGKKRQTKAKFVLLDEGNGKPGGIWQLDSNMNLFPVLIFVKSPSYQERYDFHGIARRITNKHLSSEMNKALTHALKTAKYK